MSELGGIAGLQQAAHRYAGILRPGHFIAADQIGHLDAIREYIPAALAARHLALDEVPGGWRVIGTEPKEIAL